MLNKEKLTDALQDAYTAKYADIPAENKIDWQESTAFTDKMQKQIKGQSASSLRFVNTVTKRVAMLLLATAVLAASAVILIPKVRTPIVGFDKPVPSQSTETENGVSETTTESDLVPLPESDLQPILSETIKQVYLPTSVPAEFVQTAYSKNDVSVQSRWENQSGEMIVFRQDSASAREQQTSDETQDASAITINGVEGVTFIRADSVYYLWEEKGYAFTLEMPRSFTEEQVKLITGSITEKKE